MKRELKEQQTTVGEQVYGRIHRLLGGFYEVHVFTEGPHGERSPTGEALTCRARGLFRKEGISPSVGDWVMAERTGDGTGQVAEVLERTNLLRRPPVANVEQMLLVVSTTGPAPNLLVLDKMLAIAAYKDIEAVIVLTKTDLEPGGELAQLYRAAGYEVLVATPTEGTGISEVAALLKNRVSVLCGNTGVGKSSLLNALAPQLTLDTGEVSQKLGRGRHTTRHAELYEVAGGYVADTPGFSAVEIDSFDIIYKDELAHCFIEFAPFAEHCKFHDCLHEGETACAVQDAVQRGEIAASRYQNYLIMLEDAKKLNAWEHK